LFYLHHTYSTLTGILRLPKYFKVEAEMNKKAMELLKCRLPAHLKAEALVRLPMLLRFPVYAVYHMEDWMPDNLLRFVRDEFDMTILLIEHDMKLVSGICEKLTVLNFGQVLASGNTSDVLNNPQVIKAYLGE